MRELLEGDISAFPIVDVLRLAARGRPTGVLRLTRDGAQGEISLKDGSVISASSSLAREFFGQRLVSAGLVTQAQLVAVLDEQKRDHSGRIGDLLVHKGLVTPEALMAIVDEVILSAACLLLEWDEGRFFFEETLPPPEFVGTPMGVEALILEHARRLDQWRTVHRLIPSLDAVLVLSPVPPANESIDIKPEEWRVLAMIDGSRNVRAIAAAVGIPEFETCKVLYGLSAAGLVDITDSSNHSSEVATGGVTPVQLLPPIEPSNSIEQAPTPEEPQEVLTETRPQLAQVADVIELRPDPSLPRMTDIPRDTLVKLIAGVRGL